MPTHILSYNEQILLFKNFAEAHPFINDFGAGPTSLISSSRPTNYPLMWVTPNENNELLVKDRNITPIESFTFLFVDKINNQENVGDENGNASNNGQEVLSDMKQVAKDFVADMLKQSDLGLVYYDSSGPKPIQYETDDIVNGWRVDLRLKSMYFNCNPRMGNLMFPENPNYECPDYSFELKDEAGNILSSSTISEDFIAIAPNSIYTIINQNSETIASGEILSSGSTGVTIDNSTYNVLDQFGNYLTTGSTLPVSHTDIEINLPNDCTYLVNGFITTGAGVEEANGEWIWDEISNVFRNPDKLEVYTIRDGKWTLVNAEGVDIYITETATPNPWQNTTWITTAVGVNPPPSFVQLTEPCCTGTCEDVTIRIGGYAYGPFSAGSFASIYILDSNNNLVTTTQVNSTTVKIPSLPCSGSTSSSFSSIRFSTKPNNQTDPASYSNYAVGSNGFFQTDEEHYYGHNYRFCSKIGYTDGTDYFLHSGIASDKATVFADGYVLDMNTWIESADRVLAIKLTLESSATGGAHRIAAAALEFAGIGPNRWFMWNAQIYFNLSLDNRSAINHLNYGPFDHTGNTLLFLNNSDGVTIQHYLRVDASTNLISNGGKSSSHQTIYCCWFDLIND